MKKVLGLTALVLAIATSIVSGTLAMYQIDLGVIDTGSVVAKEFKLVGKGEENFSEPVKIAPGETVTKQFTVSNFSGTMITETIMDLDITVDIEALQGKEAIQPLESRVYKVFSDGNRKPVSEDDNFLSNGKGTLTFEDGFKVETEGQTYTYEIEIKWPSDENNVEDIKYAGPDYANSIAVSVVGTQVLKEEDITVLD